MRNAVTALMLGAVLNVADGRVTVRFQDADSFVDAGVEYRSRTPSENPALAAINDLLVSLGARCIEAGRTLEIVVHDVDLAGDEEWWHRREGTGLRVLRGYASPMIQLEFVLRASDGATLADGSETLSSVHYLGRSADLKTSREPQYYEKLMLRQWFERRFCAATDFKSS